MMRMMGYSNSRKSKEEELGIEEAASAGVKSMQHLVHLLSSSSDHHHDHQEQLCRDATEATVGNLKKLISALNRTGHARFRRAPPVVDPPEDSKQVVPVSVKKKNLSKPVLISLSMTSSSSLMSSITVGEGSVSNGKVFGCCSCDDDHHNNNKKRMRPCHCSRSSNKNKRIQKSVRVKAISSKLAEIPSDDFSWRKYGQKPIKGSPYPRGYYKCTTVRGCPAKKRVERDSQDATMLILTYQGQHRHMEHQPQPPACMLSLQSNHHH